MVGLEARIQFLPAILAINAGVAVFLVLLTLVFGRTYCSVMAREETMKTAGIWARKTKKTISRRNFFKIAGTAGITAAGLGACGGRNGASLPADAGGPTGNVVYRTLTGDSVSLPGYGCMRWPMTHDPDSEGQVVDQGEVNRLVDYALSHVTV